MKYEDARKLEVGDKIVVEIGEIRWKDHLEEVRVFPVSHADVNYSVINNEEILGKLSDFQQQEKIKFTKAEKKEFDAALPKLYWKDDDFEDIQNILNSIYGSEKDFPALNQYLYNGPADKDFENQIKFVKAIEHPELIEVEKEKRYYIRILGQYLDYNFDKNVLYLHEIKKMVFGQNTFTQTEIDKLQKLSEFSVIDLNKCKEAVEDD